MHSSIRVSHPFLLLLRKMVNPNEFTPLQGTQPRITCRGLILFIFYVCLLLALVLVILYNSITIQPPTTPETDTTPNQTNVTSTWFDTKPKAEIPTSDSIL